ncbi:MAG: cysteine desulfurase family protein [Candidatus Hodarchaeales archaeon]|jgi:cysteine desulfurase
MSEKRIFLDNASTTRVADEVLEAMLPYFTEKFGIASSDYGHSFGIESKEAMDNARSTVARALNASPDEIIFTSGGTESNNLAIKGIAYKNRKKGNHIIISSIAHSSALDACEALEKEGFEITRAGVDNQGSIKLPELEQAITDKTILVSVDHGNAEIGTVQDLEKIGKICKEKNVKFHADAAQSFTRVMIDVEKMNLDLITVSGHKINGPKGTGALYVRKGVRLQKLIHGGMYERNLRGGTENIPGIVGLGKAVEIAEGVKDILSPLRDKLISRMMDEIPEVKLTGPPAGPWRLPHIASFVISYVEGESLLLHLDMRGFNINTGSACSTKKLKASHVLTAIGLPVEVSHGSVRVSVGRYNTEEEIDSVVDNLKEVVARLRQMSPLNAEFMKEWEKEKEEMYRRGESPDDHHH